jgi:molybdopterin molybdotransferase
MPLLAFSEAKAKLLASAHVVTDIETLDLAEAFGRVLAHDLISPMTVPPFSNAAMDGYAVCAADIIECGVRLPVGQRVAAGDVPQPLAAAGAARIFTGAQVPDGADAVVMQEDCRADGDFVIIDRMPSAGQHVRLKGSDLLKGKAILAAGSRFFPRPPWAWPPRWASAG